jgi:hypothetical protein
MRSGGVRLGGDRLEKIGEFAEYTPVALDIGNLVDVGKGGSVYGDWYGFTLVDSNKLEAE